MSEGWLPDPGGAPGLFFGGIGGGGGDADAPDKKSGTELALPLLLLAGEGTGGGAMKTDLRPMGLAAEPSDALADAAAAGERIGDAAGAGLSNPCALIGAAGAARGAELAAPAGKLSRGSLVIIRTAGVGALGASIAMKRLDHTGNTHKQYTHRGGE